MCRIEGERVAEVDVVGSHPQNWPRVEDWNGWECRTHTAVATEQQQDGLEAACYRARTDRWAVWMIGLQIMMVTEAGEVNLVMPPNPRLSHPVSQQRCCRRRRRRRGI